MINVCETIKRLDAWIEQNGWRGWDPYDIKEIPLVWKLESLPPLLLVKIIRKVTFSLIDLCPLGARKVLKIRPLVNPKGMGLFLAGYCNLFDTTGKKRYLEKAKECARWLIMNQNTGYSGCSWGYPFDWQSPIIIPKGTPSSIATATVGDGFYLLYKCTGDEEFLSICENICNFFLNDLKITYRDPDALCYSYTPLDDYQVHNTNLFIGEFLSRIGKETGNENWVEQGVRCGNFALKEQRPEGYLPYWGLKQTDIYSNGIIHTDHYHSGFEIRMLYGIWKNTEDERFREAYVKYFEWYLKNMFEDDGIIPKLTPDSKYPIDIHSCAEAILCQATLVQDHPEQKQHLEKTLEWVIRTMEYGEGTYTHMLRKIPFMGELCVNIPMIRWGQAWMLRALSEVCLKMKGFSN